jgi:NADPH2:quinone reductase
VKAFAIRVSEYGGPEVLEGTEIEVGHPGPGHVLVRHSAIGLNFIDTYFRSGLYPAPLPTGLGNEAAGIIEEVGEGVTGFRPGDRIGYFTGPLGAYSTMRLVEASRLVRLPDQVSDEQAAAAMLKGCTAEYLVERCAKVQPGQAVLVHAAAGGVGSILVQWLKAIGATVIAHSGDSHKADLARSLGADHSLSCPMDQLAAAARELTGGEGVPVVLDGVGASSWDASLASVARLGLVVSYGNASGPVPPFTVLDLMRAGSIFVSRPTLADYCRSRAEMEKSAGRLFEMILAGKIRIRAGSHFALKDVADAHRAVESRSTTGSTLLLP